MQKANGLHAEYMIKADDLTWDGRLRLHSQSEMPQHIKLFLPPSGTLPSFRIDLDKRGPIRRIGRLAIFETGSSSLDFSYHLYFPGIFSFNRLSELLPQVVDPIPSSYSVMSDPLPTASSLESDDVPGRFCSLSKESFYDALFSYHRVSSESARFNDSTITVHCSPCFTASPSAFLDICVELYDQCAQWLGDNGYRRLDLYLDWTEPYRERGGISSWNSGGKIYMLIPGHREVHPSIVLSLAHEIIHEWNGRSVYPATNREWWFLEGVTQLLAFQMVAVKGLVDLETLLDMFACELNGDGNGSLQAIGRLSGKKLSSPFPFSYRQALRFAYAIEKVLRGKGSRNSNLAAVLRELVDTKRGGRFTERSIFGMIGRYMDVKKLQKYLAGKDLISEISLRECLLDIDR